MQNSHIKLKEIIWEITGKCNNGCEYCGSKDAWNYAIDNETIIQIAQNIAKFPPAEIDMSGGDPLLVDYKTHETITEILHKAKVKCKILVNPKSLVNKQVISSNNILKIGLYDWVGVSINTQEELDLIQHNRFDNFLKKSTVISNFNLQNIFLYNEIEEFVKKHELIWQVQYTMYKNPEDPLALYNNEKALAFFSSQISKSISSGVKVLVADNANCGACSAGLHSIGILYNGDVVPCLSMRSWLDIKDVVVDNVLSGVYPWHDEFKENPLKFIWENRFNKYRFESFKCCKDFCNNKCVEIKLVGNKQEPDNIFEKFMPEKDSPIYQKILLYGVCPGTIKMYAVAYPEGTYVYACPGGWQDGTTISMYAVKAPPSACEENIDTKTTTQYDDTKDKNSDGIK